MPRPELSTLRYQNLWQGCVGAWCPSQSGATGYRLFDDSGNNNHGVLTNMDPGTDWVPSGGKLALDFDGTVSKSNEVLVATNSNKFSLPTLKNKVTVCAWVFNRTYPSYSGVKRQVIYIHGNRDTNNGAYHLAQGPSQTITFNLWEVSGAGVAGTTVLPTNRWIFVCGSWDGQTARVFYNGSQENESAVNITPTDSVANARIGRLGFSGFEYSVDGFIDDVRLYNRVLTSSEINLLYTGGRGAAYERSRGRKKAYVPGYRITAPSRIQTGSARTIDGTDTESLSRGLVGAWCPSLGASGYRLLDRSGNNNHGVLTNMDPGTDWVPSGGRLALDFDNTDDRVDIAVLSAINSGEVSFSFWYYPFSVTGLNTIFNNWSATVVSGGFYCFRDGTSIVFQQDNSSYRVTTGAILTANRWHHLVCRRANGTGGIRVFFNSVLDSASATAGGTQSSTAVFNLCGEYGGTGKGNCQIDDFRIYNRALTPSEISLLYTGGRGVGLLPESKPKRARIVAWDNQDKISVPARVLTNTDSLKRGLVGHWSPSLSGPQGNRLMDLSGQNNHGTLQNMDYQTDYVPSTDKGGRMALDFDGINDYVATNLSCSNRSNLDISAWIYRASTSNNAYVGAGEGGASGPRANIYIAGSTTYVTAETSGSVAYGGVSNTRIGWNHFHYSYVYIGSNSDNLKLWINGVEQSLTYTGFTPGSLGNVGFFEIGRTKGEGSYATAQIDDVRTWSRRLTPSEIRLLAQSRMPERATPQRTRTVFYSSGLVSYLRRRTYNSILGSGVLS